MAGKNFLDQFSSENKPESFQEEVFVPSKKQKKPLNITLIVVLSIVIVLGGFLTWFFVFRPTIEVPSFIGQEVSDINSWVKQQGIQLSGIVIKEEYSEEFDSKIIIEQSIDAGKKVKKNVKIDFTVSKGPDPSVSVTVPDIISMNLTEIESWISKNKLLGVKITYEFSDEDPLDSVISYEFGSNASETNFKRSSSLNIIVSKGKQEDQPVSVPNFAGKSISEATNWGSKNKIKIVQKEDFSSTVNKDMIISQSVNPGKKITSKESLTITISKGAPIIAPDFSSYSRENIQAWGTKNNVNIEIIERYSKDVAKDKVMEQSHKDKPCNDGMSVTISLGNLDASSLVGSSVEEFYKWFDEANRFGANIEYWINYKNDNDAPPNTIISFNDVEVGKKITVNVSKGKNILLKNDIENSIAWDNVVGLDEDKAHKLCKANEGLVCKFEYEKKEGTANGKVIGKRRTDKKDEYDGSYISQTESIIFTICDNGQ